MKINQMKFTEIERPLAGAELARRDRETTTHALDVLLVVERKRSFKTAGSALRNATVGLECPYPGGERNNDQWLRVPQSISEKGILFKRYELVEKFTRVAGGWDRGVYKRVSKAL